MPPAAPYDAVVFDLDGTLVDTEPLCYAGGVEATRALGIEVPLAFFEGLTGIDDRTTVKLIEERWGVTIDLGPFLADWDRINAGLFAAHGIPLLDGVADVLDRVAALGLPLGLATSSRRGPAREKLRWAGIEGRFATMVTVEDVAAAKPAPDPYLLAAERLGVDPARCLAFEDSAAGAASAHAAGLRVVRLASGPRAEATHHHLAASILDGARAAGLWPDG